GWESEPKVEGDKVGACVSQNRIFWLLAGASYRRLEFLVSRRTAETLYMRSNTSHAAPSVQPHGRNLITLVANVRSYSPYLITFIPTSSNLPKPERQSRSTLSENIL